MGSQFDSSSASGPFKVLILGGCYGGLSTALNLLDLAEGRAARQGSGVVPGHDGQIPIEVTIVDERDGFCACLPVESRITPQASSLRANLPRHVSSLIPNSAH